jgi:hypothetical protein
MLTTKNSLHFLFLGAGLTFVEGAGDEQAASFDVDVAPRAMPMETLS